MRVKATMIVALGALIALAAVAVGADLQINRVEGDQALSEAQAAGARVAAAVRDHALAKPIPDDGPVKWIQVVDGHGQVLNSARAGAGQPAISGRVPPAGERVQQYVQCGGPGGGCLAVTAIRVSTAPRSPIVYAARPLPALLTTGSLEALLAAAALALTALVASATWWVVGRTLRPVEAIRARLAEISDADLTLRVPQPPGHDEIAHLAATANATLGRLDDAVSRQRRFTSDAAHELRTPLAALRIHLEEALLFPGADPRSALQDALASAGRLEKVLADLLLLTQLGTSRALTEQIELTDLVAAEATRRSRVPIRTDLEPGLTVAGVRGDLSRLITNLLDNAERHAHTTIDVKLYQHQDQAVLAITDDGPGIPSQERERVFERFARLDTARCRTAGGPGLGLAIARDIATFHNGTLVIEDSPQGARFVTRIPSTRAPQLHPTGTS